MNAGAHAPSPLEAYKRLAAAIGPTREVQRAVRRATVEICPDCLEYVQRRGTVLGDAIADHAASIGVDPVILAECYLWCVHQRHKAGLSLATDGAAA